MRDLYVETEIPAASYVVHYDEHGNELVRVTYVDPSVEVPVMKTCISGPIVFFDALGKEVGRMQGDDIVADDRHPFGYPGPFMVAGDVITVSVTRNK